MGFGKKKDSGSSASESAAQVTAEGGTQEPDKKKSTRTTRSPSTNRALLANEGGANRNDAMLSRNRVSGGDIIG